MSPGSWVKLRHRCSAVHLLHIFRKSFHKNTSGELLLKWRLLQLCNISLKGWEAHQYEAEETSIEFRHIQKKTNDEKCIGGVKRILLTKSPYSSNSRCQMFFKVGFLKNFVIVTGKYLCLSLFSIKLQAWGCNFIKTRLQHRYFPVKFVKFLKRLFLQNTCGGCFWKPLFAAGIFHHKPCFDKLRYPWWTNNECDTKESEKCKSDNFLFLYDLREPKM